MAAFGNAGNNLSVGLSAAEALQLIPEFRVRQFDIAELRGGLTNRSFKLTDDSVEFVLRLDSERSRMFRFDRRRELAIHRKASDAGIAPRIVFADPDAGILVTEFLSGETWDVERIRTGEGLEAIATLLRQVHGIPADGTAVDLVEAARMYETYLGKRNGFRTFALYCVQVVQAAGPVRESVCCHNDVIAANVIGGKSPKLIDWEFACKNDPMFDLASVVCYHDLEVHEIDNLLRAYSGADDGELRDRLEVQMRVYDAVLWLWTACQHVADAQPWQVTRLEQIQQRIG